MATPVPQSPQLPHGPQLEAAPSAVASLAEAIAIMARLRGPDGCPWDREQTFDSIKRHTLEETYEVFDAIERRAWPDLKDELGDLLLQVLFYAQMASEAGYFTLQDVASNLNAKLIRRHPHIFGDVVASGSAEVLRNWEQIKQSEKRASRSPQSSSPQSGPQSSMLDDIPRSMPAVLEASKLGSRAAKVGFDWPNADGLFDKLQEEICELRNELAPSSESHRSRIRGPPLHRRQPRQTPQGRSRISSARHQRQVPPPLRCHGICCGQYGRAGGLHAVAA
jgi:ATP diphosphatase